MIDPHSRPQGTGQKKKFGGVEQQQHMIHRDNKTGESQKHIGQSKRGFTATPQTQLPVSHHHLSEEVSTTKTNQPILPIMNDDEPSQQMTEKYYPGRNFIPLIEEEDHDGYEDPYSIQNPIDQHQLANHSFPNIGQMQKGDSPSNYKPFGTHFGPRILNRYGGHSDFLTPQAKHVMPHQNGNLPGDTSSKSSPFQKNGHPVPKTQPVISQGFSSLAEQVVKRKVVTPNVADDNSDLN
jgi:hypothetical protein